jgi:hypothetical protein
MPHTFDIQILKWNPLMYRHPRHPTMSSGLWFNDPAVKNAIIAEGFVDLRSFAELRDKDIHELVKSINSHPLPARRGCGWGCGRAEFPLIPPDDDQPIEEALMPEQIKIMWRSACRLGGLVHWVKDRLKRGIHLDPYQFTEKEVVEALQDLVEVEVPEKFAADKWVQWEIEITNYLQSKWGLRGIPLSYVIRPNMTDKEILAISVDDITRQEIYAAPLERVAYRHDNNTVWALLKAAVITSPAWEWKKQLDGKGNGRLAMTKLRDHSDGPDKKRAQISL